MFSFSMVAVLFLGRFHPSSDSWDTSSFPFLLVPWNPRIFFFYQPCLLFDNNPMHECYTLREGSYGWKEPGSECWTKGHFFSNSFLGGPFLFNKFLCKVRSLEEILFHDAFGSDHHSFPCSLSHDYVFLSPSS